MTTHKLKSWPEFFEAVASGEKNFELRHNDRRFEVGDILILEEYDPKTDTYSGRSVRRQVACVMHGAGVGSIAPLKGLSIGYCILGLVVIDNGDSRGARDERKTRPADQD